MTVPINNKQKIPPQAPVAPRTGQIRPQRAGPARKPSAAAAVEADIETESVEFGAALLSAAASGGQEKAPASLDTYLVNFIKPNLPDPGILRASRSLPILERVLSEIIPRLEGGKDLHSLAAGVIEDEIERRRDLIKRMQQAIVG